MKVTLLQARLKAGLTQHQVQEKTGLHQSVISAWESGKRRPQYRNFIKLCEAYGMNPGDVCYDKAAWEKTKHNEEDVVMLPITETELVFLINDAIAYIWTLEDMGQALPKRGYEGRKALLEKMKEFYGKNFPKLDSSC